MEAATSKVQGLIGQHAVVVFSKSWCPYCRATKELLAQHGAKHETVELDQVDDGAAMQDALEQLTGQRSVPNIFIDHKHVGGNSDLQAKATELPVMLREAGAV